jgi:hypothetical protein
MQLLVAFYLVERGVDKLLVVEVAEQGCMEEGAVAVAWMALVAVVAHHS